MSEIRCEKCGCLVHETRFSTHPCDYLRVNMDVARAEGIKAEAAYVLQRLREHRRVPRWLADSMLGIYERACHLPRTLATYRNTFPRSTLCDVCNDDAQPCGRCEQRIIDCDCGRQTNWVDCPACVGGRARSG